MTSANRTAELPEGRVAIVTGAGRELSAATARALALAGATVVLAARTETELALVARQIAEAGRRAFPVLTDVTDLASIEPLVWGTVAACGRLDIAVPPRDSAPSADSTR